MSGQVMSVPWVHIYIFYLEPMTPLKQFLPGFRFILGFLISILASFCRFSSIFFKLLGTWWHWITFCAPMVSSGHVRSCHKIRPGKVRTCQVKTPQVGQVRSGHNRSGQVMTGQVRSSQVRSGQVRSGRAKSGQVRSSQVRSGQVRSG